MTRALLLLVPVLMLAMMGCSDDGPDKAPATTPDSTMVVATDSLPVETAVENDDDIESDIDRGDTVAPGAPMSSTP